MIPKLNKVNQELFDAAINQDINNLFLKIKNKNKEVLTLDNFIDDKELNILGLQPYRALVFDQEVEKRRASTYLFQSDYHKELEINGFIFIKNFLKESSFTKMINGIKTESLFDISPHKLWEDICKLCHGGAIQSDPIFHKSCLRHEPPGEHSDPARQYSYHYDKFFPNFKSWFYPKEISIENGPTGCYVGSHKNSVEKLRWYQETSLTHLDAPKSKKNDWGRISPTLDHTDHKVMAAKLGFEKEIILTGEANSFFIIDTRCFHRRTPAEDNVLRLSLRGNYRRDNIFLASK